MTISKSAWKVCVHQDDEKHHHEKQQQHHEHHPCPKPKQAAWQHSSVWVSASETN